MTEEPEASPWRSPEAALEASSSVLHCPNEACPHRERTGQAAEFRGAVRTCSECGAALVEGEGLKVAPPRVPGAPPWRRLAVTAAVPFAVWSAERVVVPGTDPSVVGLDQGFLAETGVSVAALGALPIFSAYYLVELAALVVPRWRRFRIGGPAGRARLFAAVVPLALVLCLEQGWMVASTMAQAGYGGEGTVGLRVSTTLILTGVSMAFWALARVVDRYGLGCGFSIIMGAGLLPFPFDLATRLMVLGLPGAGVTPPMMVLALLVFAVTWFAQTRRPRLGQLTIPVPASSIAPVTLAASILMLPAILVTFNFDLTGLVDRLHPGSALYTAVNLGLALTACVVLGWLFNRPSNVARLLAAVSSPHGSAPERDEMVGLIRRAILASVGYVGLLIVTQMIADRTSFLLRMLEVGLITTIVLDVIREWRARTEQAGLISVWPVHRLYAVGPVVAALKAAGIYAFPRALCHRSMLQFFGPQIPVEILVFEADADRARALLTSALLSDPASQLEVGVKAMG